MSKKRITVFLNEYPQPAIIAWYLGTPQKDILDTIRAVSLLFCNLNPTWSDFDVTNFR